VDSKLQFTIVSSLLIGPVNQTGVVGDSKLQFLMVSKWTASYSPIVSYMLMGPVKKTGVEGKQQAVVTYC
jgi:hypothetical protein